MLKFNTSKITENDYGTYTLSEFNGVDYTTTPTKVDDTRAIEISNYKPEGDCLVKRYGYSNVLDLLNRSEFSVYRTTKTFNGETYEPEMEYKILERKNDLILLIQYVYKGTNWKRGAYGIYRLDFNGNTLTIETVKTITETNANWQFNGLLVEVGTSTWLFAFSKHWEMQEYNGETKIREVDPYIPTIYLNYGGTSDVAYEQLNLLTKYFYIEHYLQFDIIYNSSGVPSIITDNSEKGNVKRTLYIDTYYLMYKCPTQFDNRDTKMSASGVIEYTPFVSNVGNDSLDLNVGETHSSYQKIIINWPEPEKTITEYNDWVVIETPSATNTELANQRVTYTGKVKIKYEFISYTTFIPSMACIYGIKNSADRIFFVDSANPNTDYHTLDNKDGIADYTYIGAETYHAIGNKESAIVGYSLLNDGSLAILKEPQLNQSNIYVRTGEIETSTENYEVANTTYSYTKTIERYPTFATGLIVNDITKDTKIINYDNKLIFNTQSGVYYLNLNSTTSNQSYAVKELSYYIRNDLSTNIDDSSVFVYKDNLFVVRENKNGIKRVYLANRNEYSFINSELQYNWWVLDNIPCEEFYKFDDTLYFMYNNKLFRFYEKQFYDYDVLESKKATLNGVEYTTELYLQNNTVMIDKNSDLYNTIENLYKHNVDIKNDKERKMFVLNNGYINIQNEETVVMIKAPDFIDYENISEVSGNKLVLTVDYDKLDFINKIIENKMYISYMYGDIDTGDYAELIPSFNNVDYVYNDNNTISIIINYSIVDNPTLDSDVAILYEQPHEVIEGLYFILGNNDLKISDLKDENDVSINDYEYDETIGWTYEGISYDKVDFTTYTLNIFGEDVEIISVELYGTNEASSTYLTKFMGTASASISFKMPIVSYWYSKFYNFNHDNVLKTTKTIHFIPETRRGGLTNVGYRTNKKEKLFVANAPRSSYYSSKDTGVDFTNIDFDNFNFEGTYFAKSYNSKKKIKNFSFIQFMFSGDEKLDSTISSLTVTYLYTKNSKGVK